MRLKNLFLLLLLAALGCKNTPEESKEKNELVMVETSEMAKLMNEMYAYNESVKQQIINSGTISANYPEKFDNIHSAILTDPSDRDESFEAFSNAFIATQKNIFDAAPDNLTTNYNNSINACISCHEVKCVGPIPRIKKLLIK